MNIEKIYKEIKKILKEFEIKIKENEYTGLKSIVIRWSSRKKGGFFISQPFGMNTDKFICEYCFIDEKNALYAKGNKINEIENIDELLREFYRHYYRIICMNNWEKKIELFKIKNYCKKREEKLSLITRCKMLLSTLENENLRQYLMII